MTLAPSRRLPLSGNKSLIAFFCALVWLNASSCRISRTGPPAPVPQIGKVKIDHPAQLKKDTVHRSIQEVRMLRQQDSLNLLFPPVFKDRYSILLVQPFNLNDPEQAKKQTSSSAAIEFYKGMLIAADTLQYCGLNLDLHAVDSEDPRLYFTALQDTLHRLNCDLIIGPILDGRLTFLDSLAVQEKINYVSPLQTIDVCRGSNYYFESFPSSAVTVREVASAMKKEYPDFKYFLVNERTTKENPLAGMFASQFGKDSLLTVDFLGYGASTYAPPMPIDTENVFFIPSRNEAFVTAFLAQLRKTTKRNIVFGMTPWLYFNSQEGDLWERFNFHIPAPFHIDYSGKAVSDFVRAYRRRFQSEPGVFAFIGFDELWYYSGLLKNNGRYFQRNMPSSGQSALHTIYKMKYDTKCGGWKNTFVNMLRFENYELNIVNDK